MKTVTSIAAVAIAVASLGAASTASAYTFNPKGKTWTATGTSLLQHAISCTTNYTGFISATGTLTIRTAKYSGTNPACAVITATGLPWHTKAMSLTTANILKVGVTAPGISCGPGTVAVTVPAGGGTIAYDTTLNPGNCAISGATNTIPVITISNP
jgi:hypothetical protein